MGKDVKHINGHQLYYYAACPYCIAVRVVLWKRGLKLPLKDILFHPSNDAELIAGGGMSQVPCLRIEREDGSVEWMYDSSRIIRYLKTELSG